MSTENEGHEGAAVPDVPPAPSAPPVPAAAPEDPRRATPPAPGAPATAHQDDAARAAHAEPSHEPPYADGRGGDSSPSAEPAGPYGTTPAPADQRPAAPAQPDAAHAPAPDPAQGRPQAPAHAPGADATQQLPPHTPAYPAPHTPAPAYPAPQGAPAYPAPHNAAPAGSWPPPAPPAVPAYAGGGDGHGGTVWGASAEQEPKGPRKRRAGGLVAMVAVAALVAGGVGGALGFWAADSNDDGSSGSTTISASDSPKALKRADGTVAGVAAKSLPSVVTIDAQNGDGEGGTGTGFVYDKEGHILTNNHVVASAAESGQLTATFSDGKKYEAEVVGRAEGYDVAVIKLKNAPSGLNPLALGNSDNVAVGDSTIAIGAPFGLSNTVTTGIISAKNRPVASSDGSSSSSSSYMSALQTDASINPGNSGGPLLDATGAVIGINSAIQSTGSGAQTQAGSIGLGFAIPINQAKNVAEQLIKTGQPVYPVIGATVSMSETGDGAVISDQGSGSTAAVAADGPAAKAGLKAGDVITKFNDTPVDSGPTLIGEIWTHKPGDRVTLTYERDGKESTVELTLGERKGDS
ncbi:trypsin-like peptidase domain-containing protein [Streptomyces sp. NBC_01218]|uniref:S1C family serine protease n=1 Tax=unclassified Streptomyces TaxID=2593676 RepID=UPI0023B945B8|nr:MULTISPECIES: trypsin-like peptidase domain-containing protein [unclassified Streptomyces]WEH40905.1 trypsin-like peptidase domain-containing protein [Streptomyces sp. AM 2-1-1]WSQ52564.1 trypsin-like peptidase domain-containing protein [Streptomyces sp. NBC_01218]